MKKLVSIFIAGSKELMSERDALKALAHRMNTRYNRKKIDVLLELSSYEDLKSDQNVYNAYISQTADIVLFVFDGKINPITETEFNVAVDAYKQKRIPEIFVFIKKYKEETSEIQYVRKLIRDRLGNNYYYEEYDNESNLKTKAQNKIEDYINPIAHNRSAKKWRMMSALIAVSALLLITGITYYFFSHNEKRTVVLDDEPLLLFMGGGSVTKFIENSENGWGIKIDSLGDDFHNTLYMGVPSGNLWNMLGEEYYKNKEVSVSTQKFYPIFLAADTISISQIRTTIPKNEEVSNNILIFKTYLGDDPINTYVGSQLFQSMKVNEDYYVDRNGNKYHDSIQLNRLLEQHYKKNLYTTSPNSGTLGKYKGVVDGALIDSVLKYGHVYNEHRPITSGNDFVILGSQFYYPDALPNHEKLFVKATNSSEYLYKKLYLYFIAYCPTISENRRYMLPKPVRRFFDIISKKGRLIYTEGGANFSWDDEGYVNVNNKDILPDGVIDLTLQRNKDK